MKLPPIFHLRLLLLSDKLRN